MESIILKSPCDLYGRNAIRFQQYIQSLGISVWIEKSEFNRRVDCISLIGILSLGVVKNDEIKISTYNKKELDSVVWYIDELRN